MPRVAEHLVGRGAEVRALDRAIGELEGGVEVARAVERATSEEPS